MRIAVLALIAAFLAGGAAHAATFDFTKGRGAQAQALNFDADDLSLTVFGAVDYRGGLYRYGTVGHWDTGLGLLTSSRESHLVDGDGYAEALFFEFSEAVRLTSITFSYGDRDDDFALYTLDADGLGRRLSDAIGFAGAALTRYDFATAFASTLFGIGAPGRDDAFKIAGIGVERVASPDIPAAIPLPPAAALLIAGLGALGLLARRQRPAA